MTQPQKLHAILRANVGRLVTYADIFRAVWGDAPPKWAAVELRTMMSEVRRKLPPGGRIKALNKRGYTLLLPDRVDLEPFEAPRPRAPSPFPVRAWPDDESEEAARQYRAGVPVKRITIPGRTQWGIRAHLSQLFRQGTLQQRGPLPQNRLPRVVIPAEPKPQTRKPRTCLACGRTFVSEHAGNRLCGRHNGETATPFEAGYAVAGVRVRA